jgi:hypothetical protein
MRADFPLAAPQHDRHQNKEDIGISLGGRLYSRNCDLVRIGIANNTVADQGESKNEWNIISKLSLTAGTSKCVQADPER